MKKVEERFGRLIVLNRDVRLPEKSGRTRQYYHVRCDCGNELDVAKSRLVSGNTKSCGCLHKEWLIARNTKHGQAPRTGKSKLYVTWGHMIARCYNPKEQFFVNYGGRGITVCDEWKEFIPFSKWATKNGHQDGLSIERVDVNGNYCPENCCFIPIGQQACNTTRSAWVTCFGETKIISDWARDSRCVVGEKTLGRRIRQNWSPVDAITIPANFTNHLLHLSRKA